MFEKKRAKSGHKTAHYKKKFFRNIRMGLPYDFTISNKFIFPIETFDFHIMEPL